MKFHLIDRITALEPGKKLVAYKNLTMAEEYLADHFPGFPVMPGVLMLETLVQAGAWLLRLSENFKQSTIVLRDARNVKYGSFMDPGHRLDVEVELIERNEETAILKGIGKKEGASTINARFMVATYNLASLDPANEPIDQKLTAAQRERSRLIWRGQPTLVA